MGRESNPRAIDKLGSWNYDQLMDTMGGYKDECGQKRDSLFKSAKSARRACTVETEEMTGSEVMKGLLDALSLRRLKLQFFRSLWAIQQRSRKERKNDEERLYNDHKRQRKPEGE